MPLSKVVSNSLSLTTLAASGAATLSSTLGVTGVTTVQAGTAALPAITTSGDTNTGIFFPGADTIAFSEGGAERMRLNASGNVGIGTNAPDANLTVNGAASFAAGTALLPSIARAGDLNTGIFFPAADTIAFAEGGAEVVRITSDGRLLVGTTSSIGTAAVGRVQIKDFETFISTNNEVGAVVGINSNIDNSAFIGADPDNLRAGSFIAFGVDGPEKMRIDSSGNLLVGTTSPAPGYGNTNTGVQISGSGSTFSRAATDYVMVVNQNTADGPSYYQMIFRVANVAKGSIISTSTATAYNTSSDYRLKENIQPMTGALAKVEALKPCTYKWKVDGSGGQGFIAHELDEVVSGCVTGEKDAEREEQYEVTPAVKDADGNTITEAVMGTRMAPQYQGIDTSFLVATLTAAIQEQQALITALTATTTSQTEAITVLTARIAALESTP